jgi:hypothetical protein
MGCTFNYECLLSSAKPMSCAVVKVGKSLHFRIRELCQRLFPGP